jgi:membrane-associated phospholipid phosphatase
LALAVCCAYAARGIRILFPLLLALNLLVILATPLIGGHHFADLVGGALLTALVLFVFRKKGGQPIPEKNEGAIVQ